MTLINKMLNELKTSEEVRERTNNLHVYNCTLLNDNQVYHNGRLWHELNTSTQAIVIMSMLSKGVMEFLDRQVDVPRDYGMSSENLGKLLYTEFTEALYNGKPLDEAIQIIEDIYGEYA